MWWSEDVILAWQVPWQVHGRPLVRVKMDTSHERLTQDLVWALGSAMWCTSVLGGTSWAWGCGVGGRAWGRGNGAALGRMARGVRSMKVAEEPVGSRRESSHSAAHGV